MERCDKYKLPKVLRLGGGSRVLVCRASKEVLATVYGTTEKPDYTACGCWDIEKGIIWIGDFLTPRQAWETYWHELLHAVHDMGLCFKGGV